MIKSRITAAIWPWGTETREQMETAAAAVSKIGYENFESVKAAIYAYDLDLKAYKEVLDKYKDDKEKAAEIYSRMIAEEIVSHTTDEELEKL